MVLWNLESSYVVSFEFSRPKVAQARAVSKVIKFDFCEPVH